MAAVFGFHSLCGTVTSSPFIFDPAESKKNYIYKETGKQSALI